MKKLTVKFAVAVAIGLLCTNTRASDDSLPSFNVRGFGTLGVVHSDNKSADFTTNAVFQPRGAGYSKSVSASPDSKVGLQFDSQFNESLSAVLQVVSQQNYDGSYKPHVEWANVSFDLTPDLRLRLGRTLWPVMLRSETRNIGFGNPFIRNSSEMIANMPNTFSDGADLTYKFNTGSVSNALTLLVGKSRNSATFKDDNGDQAVFAVDQIRGISHVSEFGDWKLHAAYMTMVYSIGLPGLPLNDVSYKTATLGFNYDPGSWFATADFMRAADATFGNAVAYTAGAGVRLGAFTPYVSYSAVIQKSVGPLLLGTVGDSQRVTGVGVRWDLTTQQALKLSYETVRSGPIASLFPSTFANVQPAFYDNPRAHVISATFNFVF